MEQVGEIHWCFNSYLTCNHPGHMSQRIGTIILLLLFHWIHQRFFFLITCTIILFLFYKFRQNSLCLTFIHVIIYLIIYEKDIDFINIMHNEQGYLRYLRCCYTELHKKLSIINFHFPGHLVPICFLITRLILWIFSTLIFMPSCRGYRKNHPVYQHHCTYVSLYSDVCSFIAGIFISFWFYFQIEMIVVVTGSYFYLFCKMYCQWWWTMQDNA